MSKKFVNFSIFFIVLLGLFLLLLSQLNGGNLLKKRYKTISTVKAFRFTTQDSTVFTNANIVGKVAVVEYFFTTCTSICPAMNVTMKKLYEEYKNEPDFLVMSHTSDPKIDNPKQLKKYADSIGAGKNWVFLTGGKADLYFHARNSYSLDDPAKKVADPEKDFIHTQLFALVTKEGVVKRRVYDSSKPEEVEDLRKDIKLALAGKL